MKASLTKEDEAAFYRYAYTNPYHDLKTIN